MKPQTEDKRQLDRVRTILAGQVIVSKALGAVDCQIKDLSETGARIVVEDRALPDRFQLRIPKKSVTHNVLVRWRHGVSLGVEFVVDRRAVERVDPVTRVLQLEAENAELRRRLADMAERLYAYGDSERPST